MEDGKYYIGQCKNGVRNGKGITYYSNGKIMYEGDYIKGKIEGNWKMIFEDGYSYIGQFKNGLRIKKWKRNIVLFRWKYNLWRWLC